MFRLAGITGARVSLRQPHPLRIAGSGGLTEAVGARTHRVKTASEVTSFHSTSDHIPVKSTLYTAVRALFTAALLSSTALLAPAQTITPGANSASCQVAPAATGLQYTFTPGSGQTLLGWVANGDLQITSAPTDNPVTVQSTGLGRGQIVANYTIGTCTQFPVYYEVNKLFSTTEPIIGPECVLPGGAYTWSIKPIISSATQIGAQIGIDKYTWKIDAVSGTPPDLPTDADSYSGDLSAIRIVMPANVGAFTLSVKVGDCNDFGPSISVRPSPPTPVFIAGPSCRPTSDVSAFNITITSLPGVKYTWNVPPTWTINTPGANTGIIASSTTSTINVTPDANGGDITVTASNGGSCAEPTARYTLKRQLSPSAAFSGIPACFTVNTPYTISVAPVANNSKFYWSIPSGYSGNGTPGPAVVETGSSSISIVATTSATGRLAVSSDQCGDPAVVPNQSGVISATLKASGDNGCTYGWMPTSCGVLQLTSGVSTCLPVYSSSLNPGVTYTFSSPNNPAVTQKSRSYAPDNGLTNEIITVTVKNTTAGSCFEANFMLGPITLAPCAARPAPGGSTSKTPLMVYPNPTSGSLNIDLPLQAGETGKLTLTDATGRQHLVSSTKEARAKLDVSKLPQGVYTLRAELTSGKVLTQKVVVSHDAPASSVR